jgi:hypothetical protein
MARTPLTDELHYACCRFARDTTLPLLDGINAFTHCYVQRTVAPNGSLTLNDWNALSPDEVPVPPLTHES